MGYIGNDTQTIISKSRKAYVYTATNGQTVFTGADTNGESLDCSVDTFVNVYLNGVKLVRGVDFALTTDTLTLTTAAAEGDDIQIVSDIENSIHNTYTRDEVNTTFATKLNPEFTGSYVKLPSGSTAQRPSTGDSQVGMIRYNTDFARLEQYTVDGWAAIDTPPTITSLAYSGGLLAADPAGGETITLTGSNLQEGFTITVDGSTPPSTTYINNTTVQFTTPAKTAGDYDVKLTNTNGLTATLQNGISYNGTPAFTTPVGKIGESLYASSDVGTITIVASEPDGGALAYSVTSGALPSGLSLSSGGDITGTTPEPIGTTTYNFTVTATDDENQTNSRAFNLVVLRPVYTYKIDGSARFSGGGYLYRTPASAGNRKTWTWSAWVKKTDVNIPAGGISMFYAGNDTGSPRGGITFGNSGGDRLAVWGMYYNNTSTAVSLETSAQYRDVGSWYHIVVALDTTQATETERCKIYVNGERVTDFNLAAYPTQNSELMFNDAILHATRHPSGSYSWQGNMAEVHFIDGHALSPTDFGEFYNGVWIPKEYTGTYNYAGNDIDIYNSVTLSGPGGNPLSYLLDGDTTTGWNVGGVGTNTATFSPAVSSSSSVRISAVLGATDGQVGSTTNIVRVNGTDVTAKLKTANAYLSVVWIDVTAEAGSALSSLDITATSGVSNPSITAIEIDGTVIQYRPASTNGFYLDMGTDFEADQSGNGNNWTNSIINADDRISDSPTNNFATLSSVQNHRGYTISEGNLSISFGTSGWGHIPATIGVSTGKFYWEQHYNGQYNIPGITTLTTSPADMANNHQGYTNHSLGLQTHQGTIYINNANPVTGLTIPSAGDILGMALDVDGQTLSFYLNNTLLTTYDYSASDINGTIFPAASVYGTDAIMNFGQDSSFAGNKTAQNNTDANGIGDFYYEPPAGYLALCSKNLDEPVIDTVLGEKPSDHFGVLLYSGNGSSQAVTGLDFDPDVVWLKVRNTAGQDWVLQDSLRGFGSTTKLSTSNVAAEGQTGGGVTDPQWGYVASNTAGGFNVTVGSGTGDQVNHASKTYAAYCWKAGTPTVNNNGSIQSTVSANTAAGFSLVTWVGNGSAGSTIGHGLNKAPEIIIPKSRFADANWHGYAGPVGPTKGMMINNDSLFPTDPGYWNNTAPSDSLITLGTYNTFNTETYIAYCWHSVEGYSKIGHYTGNGSTDGPFIYTGFKPALVIYKHTDATDNWVIMDTTRSQYNSVENRLFPDASQAESTSAGGGIDATSNGFKVRNTYANANANGGSYIYMAFAEDPFKYSEAR